MDIEPRAETENKINTENDPQIIVLSERPASWIGRALICLGVFIGTSIIVAIIVSTIGAAIYGGNMLIEGAVFSGEIFSNITNISSLIADIIVVLILVPMLKKNKIWNWIPLDRRIGKNAENIALIILIFIAFFYVELCSGELLDSIFNTKEAALEQQATLTLGSRGLMLLNVALIVPITEEIVFRGGVFGSLKKTMGVVPAALISSLAFGIAHLNGWISIVTFFIGLLLCLVYEKTGSIIYSIAIHAVNNYISVTLEEVWLPEQKVAMAALALGCTVAAGVLAVVFSRRNRGQSIQRNV